MGVNINKSTKLDSVLVDNRNVDFIQINNDPKYIWSKTYSIDFEPNNTELKLVEKKIDKSVSYDADGDNETINNPSSYARYTFTGHSGSTYSFYFYAKVGYEFDSSVEGYLNKTTLKYNIDFSHWIDGHTYQLPSTKLQANDEKQVSVYGYGAYGFQGNPKSVFTESITITNNTSRSITITGSAYVKLSSNSSKLKGLVIPSGESKTILSDGTPSSYVNSSYPIYIDYKYNYTTYVSSGTIELY